MNNKPVAFINIEERKLEWAKPTVFNTPTIAKMDKIPLYTQETIDETQALWYSKGHSDGQKISILQSLFTDAEIDAIYSAMGDYADYGEEEAELADSIRNKLS